MTMLKKFLSFILLFFSGICFCQTSDFLKGESLFKENKVEEAVPYLKNAISQGGNPKAYNYLALSYHKLGMYEESLEVCSEGMKVSGTDKKVLAFNAGNVCFEMEDYYTAERWFSLAIAANRIYAPPVLNRANTELKQNKYLAALEDYKLYLDLSPNDGQKPEIEQLIQLLEGWKKAEEERIAEEKRLKEEERILAEQKRLDAEEAALTAATAASAAQAEEEKAKAAEEKAKADEALQQQLNEKFAEQARLLEEQREELKKLIEEQKAAQEAQRLENAKRQEETAKWEAENARRAEEEAKRAEEDAARRRKLLEDVAASLQNSGSSNMNAGAEGTVDYGYETELE